jgi:hypothetical protein
MVSRKKIMVLLGGGRIPPNIAGVLSLRPDEVRYLISEDQPKTHDDMLSVLGRFDGLKADGPMEVVPAHHIPAIKAKTHQILANATDADVVFNVTCGSKTMAIAVYEVAKDLGHRVIYVDSFANRIIDWTWPDQEEELIRTTIDDFLAALGRTPQRKFDFADLLLSENDAVLVAENLVAAGAAADSLLLGMRQLGWTESEPRRHFKSKLGNDETAVLQMMQDLELVTDVVLTNRGYWCYTIPNAPNWNFIKGDWLEVYVHAQASRLKQADERPLFDHIAFSVRLPADAGGAEREIDFAGLYGWQLVWASCKVERNPLDKRYLNEVAAINTMIGGRYATPIFICNGRGDAENAQAFRQQAEAAKIVVVMRDRLPDIGAVLRNEAVKPTYGRS